jgi:hypothetical protein
VTGNADASFTWSSLSFKLAPVRRTRRVHDASHGATSQTFHEVSTATARQERFRGSPWLPER